MTPYQYLENRLRAEMVEGNMHLTLRNLSCLAGGHLEAGSLSLSELDQTEALACDLAINREEALKTWREGVSYGRKRPLTCREYAGHREDRVLDWNSEIRGYEIMSGAAAAGEMPVNEPTDWDPIAEIRRYLLLIYGPDDHVGYTMDTFESTSKDGEIRHAPGRGCYQQTRDELLAELDRYKSQHDPIALALGTYDPQVGAWIRPNPLDGNGISDRNVTAFRYALVESDKVSIEQQRAVYTDLELPIVALIHSGNKSLHAIVKVDAPDRKEYDRRVDLLYQVCERNGLEIDRQNRNPSRLSRMPGISRNGHKQFIVATNLGKSTWDDWEEWIEATNDDLGEPELSTPILAALPPLSPELIEGVLRRGHKMLISGPSKAGKSYLLIELSVAIAEGREWLRLPCDQGRVLYVNLELDRASFFHRLANVYAGLGWPQNNSDNIDVWNLRGKAVPMDRLAPKLIRRANKKNYTAVVIDPIYKVITGDENAADKMAYFCNQFDKVCRELGVAVIYCHHHSKGLQGAKRSMDRASGSGVFARDPDTLLDLIELDVPKELIAKQSNPMASAWRVEGTFREFPRTEPISCWFDHPIHRVDSTNLQDMLPHQEQPPWKKAAQAAQAGQAARSTETLVKLQAAYNDCLGDDGTASILALADYHRVSDKTIKGWCRKWHRDGWSYANGRVSKLQIAVDPEQPVQVDEEF